LFEEEQPETEIIHSQKSKMECVRLFLEQEGVKIWSDYKTFIQGKSFFGIEAKPTSPQKQFSTKNEIR